MAEAFAADNDHVIAWGENVNHWMIARLDGTRCWDEARTAADDVRPVEVARSWALRAFDAAEDTQKVEWSKVLTARRLAGIVRLSRGLLRARFVIRRCTEHGNTLMVGNCIVGENECLHLEEWDPES